MDYSFSNTHSSAFILQLSEPAILLDQHGHVQRANPAMEQFLGLSGQAILGLPLLSLIHPYDRLANENALKALWTGRRKQFKHELCLTFGHDRLIQVLLEGTLLSNPDHVSHSTLVVFRDLTDQRSAVIVERLNALMDYHRVTGWAQAHLMRDRIQQVLRRSEYRRCRSALLLLGFGPDQDATAVSSIFRDKRNLINFAERMELVLRKDCSIGHDGQNQWCIIIEDANSTYPLARWLQHLLRTCREAMDNIAHHEEIQPYIGLSIYPDNGRQYEELLAAAAKALRGARQSDQAGFQFAGAEQQVLALARLKRGEELRRALDRQEFTLFYQPVIDLKTRTVRSVEALLRWQHPELGLLLPDTFIRDLEEAEMLEPVSHQILLQACRQIRLWRKTMGDLCLSINVFPQMFVQPEFPEVIDRALEGSGLTADALQLEITETTLIKALQVAPEHFDAMQTRGVKIAIDDYGTGISSLTQLHRAAIRTLKIDGRMIGTLPQSELTATIATAILGTARHCNYDVVAEGVETEEQFTFLQGLNCQQLQGFYLACPMPPEQFSSWDGRPGLFH